MKFYFNDDIGTINRILRAVNYGRKIYWKVTFNLVLFDFSSYISLLINLAVLRVHTETISMLIIKGNIITYKIKY